MFVAQPTPSGKKAIDLLQREWEFYQEKTAIQTICQQGVPQVLVRQKTHAKFLDL